MAKKKVARKSLQAKSRLTVKKKSVKPRPAPKPVSKKSASVRVKKGDAKPAASPKPRVIKAWKEELPESQPAHVPRPTGLGRPKVAGHEKLYLFFRDNYHARQIFEFLRVETIEELERHPAKEILRRLTEPVRMTVESIRETLAKYNRCLADDAEFLREYREKHPESES